MIRFLRLGLSLQLIQENSKESKQKPDQTGGGGGGEKERTKSDENKSDVYERRGRKKPKSE